MEALLRELLKKWKVTAPKTTRLPQTFDVDIIEN
jgi:hypothetical protein